MWNGGLVREAVRAARRSYGSGTLDVTVKLTGIA